MKFLKAVKDHVPSELKRRSSAVSVIVVLIVAGFFNEIGKLLLGKLLTFLPPITPALLELAEFLFSFSIRVNIVSLVIFVVFLFPVYRYIDKVLLKRFKKEIIFEDDFESGNKGWNLNYWGSNNPSKTNRIEDSTMVFEADENDLAHPKKEYGAYFDLKNGIYSGYTYEVSCRVKSAPGTTMRFLLWLHDTTSGQTSVREPNTPKTPSTSFEEIKIKYTATPTEAIRIHLHNVAGKGKVLVDRVKVLKV